MSDVLYFAAECKPFSKVGGVGDVAGELPPALLKQGIKIEVVTPLYGVVAPKYVSEKLLDFEVSFGGKTEFLEVYRGDLSGVPVNFVKNATYFEGSYSTPYVYSKEIPFYDDILRFSFFSFACLELIKKRQPEIVHINDWLLGYLFGLLEMHGLPQRRVLTIHNIGYQGNIGHETISGWDIGKITEHKKVGKLFEDPRPEWQSVNPLRLALELADATNTVSPTYAVEMTKPENQDAFFEGGKGLEKITRRLAKKEKLFGILNGFEYKEQATQKSFTEKLNQKQQAKQALGSLFQKPNALLLGFVGRAVEQKFRLLTEKLDGLSVLEHILKLPNVNVAILATGLPEYAAFLQKIKEQYPENCHCTIAFDREMAQKISLGSDVFLMPSLFEPCGITQMESMANATPPLVRFTGGLVDTVVPHTFENGFGFKGRSREAVLTNLIKSVKHAARFFKTNPEQFKQIQRNAFFTRFMWETAAKEYIEKLY